jgi:hypothetical protein
VYEGATETFFYSDVTDSEHNATIHTGNDLKSKTRWDHDVLKVTTTQSGAVTLESYTLAADGTMMVSVEAGAQADYAHLPAQIEELGAQLKVAHSVSTNHKRKTIFERRVAGRRADSPSSVPTLCRKGPPGWVGPSRPASG